MKRDLKRGIIALLTVSMLTTSGCSNVDDLINKSGLKEYIQAQQGADDKLTSEKDTDANKQDESDKQEGQKQDKQNQQSSNNALGAVYSGKKIKVKRNEIINLDIGYDYYEDGEISALDAFEIYTDSSLKIKADGIYAQYHDDTGKIEIDPQVYSVGLFSKYAHEEELEAQIATLPKTVLFDSGDDENHTWGNLPRYYLVSYIDSETGKKLDTPEITVIEIEEEIAEAPRVTYSQTDDGSCRIYWKPVDGAERYVIYALSYSKENGYGLQSDVLAITDQTEWVQDAVGYSDYMEADDIDYMNQQFHGYNIKVDDYDDAVYIGVLAVNSTGASSFSNMTEVDDIRATLPYTCAYGDKADSDTDTYNMGSVDYISQLPSTAGVEMCDESVVPKVIEYDIDNYQYDEEYDWVYVNSKVVGTKFTQKFTIFEANKDTCKEELAKIKERQESLIKKGGDTLGPDVTITDGEPDEQDMPDNTDEPNMPDNTDEPNTPDNTDEPDTPSDVDTSDVYGNSELSKYIGAEMLQTKSAIDVSGFPESADSEVLLDAFHEAKNQNPLILGVKSLNFDSNSRILYVEYYFDADTMAQKQQEIKAKVNEVISSIITDGMSDLEKELAINNYICENAVYDDAACDNAKEHDFYGVDEQYYDSFTAYGILINGVGVCASYAADFKLLADAAGLESRIVTGMLEGSLPHAWNKVKIDGNWCIVDATNNDNDYMQNGLLNLSDETANGVLTQNDDFVLDENVSDYAATSDDKEYYHVSGKFFSKDEIASKLTEELSKGDATLLRTDYDLNETEFNQIAQEVANQSKFDLTGGYWFGMIYLKKE